MSKSALRVFRVPGRWLDRFLDWNRRTSDDYWTPRLFMVPHVAALDYWMYIWVGTDAFPSGRDALLEFGSGRSFHLSQLVGPRFRACYATDLADVTGECVPAAVEFRRCTPDRLPFADSNFDAIVVRSVVEHIEHPLVVFAELSRVLKPGGLLFANLPNKWDYVSVMARLAGSRKSDWLRKTVKPDWDDFPAFYRCNTRRSLYRTARATGFDIEVFRPLPSEPGYLRFLVPVFLLGATYQFVISLLSLDILQPSFLIVLRKRTQVESHNARG